MVEGASTVSRVPFAEARLTATRAPKPSVEAILQCLPQHGYGYTLSTSYQPGSRFWPFQLIEGGWLLALSVLLIAVTVWLVRRRAA